LDSLGEEIREVVGYCDANIRHAGILAFYGADVQVIGDIVASGASSLDAPSF
jgi:hypothetical protein